VVISLERGADCLHMVWLMPLPSPNPMPHLKSRLLIPFWYRFTQVVLEKEAIKRGCSSSSSSNSSLVFTQLANATGVISVCGSR